MVSAKDCCKGEPGYGDPRGLHSEDCPEYLASMAALERRTRRPEPAPPVVELSTSARLRETQGALAASQADLTRAEREIERLVRHLSEANGEVARLREGLAAVLAELRRLALANRRDACGLAQPYCFGPTRAAEAYEKAAAIVEQKLGGESRG